MDEFISLIQFHTAIPFGYLLFSLFWLAVVAWALKNVLGSLWRKRVREPKMYFAGGLLVLAFGYAYASLIYSENLNMNPFFNESDLVGEWEYSGSKLMLKPDGTARIGLTKSLRSRLNIDNGEGYWRKEGDFNLIVGSNPVNSTSKNGMLRVIQYAESYRLIVEDYDDPDMWDGSLGFKHKSM